MRFNLRTYSTQDLSVCVIDEEGLKELLKLKKNIHESHSVYIFDKNENKDLVVNGKQFLRQGNVFLIKSKTPHTFVSYEGLKIIVQIKSENLDSLNNMNEGFLCTGEFENRTLHYIKEFMKEIDRKGKDHIVPISIGRLINLRVYNMFKDMETDDLVIRMDPVVRKVSEFIHINIHKKITDQMMAEDAEMTIHALRKRFKRLTGMTPKEYIIYLRLERGKKMLVKSDVSITDIAIECGFNSMSYFGRQFKKRYNIGPKEYRKTYGNNI